MSRLYHCALCGGMFESLVEHIYGTKSPGPPEQDYYPEEDDDLGLSRTTLRWVQEAGEHEEWIATHGPKSTGEVT